MRGLFSGKESLRKGRRDQLGHLTTQGQRIIHHFTSTQLTIPLLTLAYRALCQFCLSDFRDWMSRTVIATSLWFGVI